MDFLNKKDQKYHLKMLQNAMARVGLFKIKNLVLNHTKTKIKVGKIKTQQMLLEVCGLANEYPRDMCFLMLASKFDNSLLFKKPYVLVYCSVDWKVQEFVTCEPNNIIKKRDEYEYVFIMSPNLVQFIEIQIGDHLRI